MSAVERILRSADLKLPEQIFNDLVSLYDQATEELKSFEKFHPRAVKLLRKRKNFIVIAEDEPYFMAAYSMIRSHEMAKGTWTPADEQQFYAEGVKANGWPSAVYGKNLCQHTNLFVMNVKVIRGGLYGDARSTVYAISFVCHEIDPLEKDVGNG